MAQHPCGDPAAIELTLAEEGSGSTSVTVEWANGADLEEQVTSVQRHRQKKQAGTASLGWADPLETYRPMLTYEELGAILTSRPSDLYDAISRVLGLEQLATAEKALNAHKKSETAPRTQLANDKKALRAALAELDDERAVKADGLLKSRTLDPTKLRHLATGSSVETDLASRVRPLLTLTVPSDEDCRQAAADLRAMVSDLARAGEHVDEALRRRNALIRAALEVHTHEGDQPCPLCQDGTLDAERATALQAEMSREEEQFAALRQARKARDAALERARALAAPTPAALSQGQPDRLEELVRNAARIWTTWAGLPIEPLAIADHLTTHRQPVHDALTELQDAARNYLQELDDDWSRIAAPLAAFADAAESWDQRKEKAEAAEAAHKWLKSQSIDLKNERVQPIAESAKKIWSGLRQNSNVEIADLTLEGTNTSRRVEIEAAVDGEEAGGLSVMSQGELHALALALFLPRATMPQSPFRFVVLDDPVQAMDPAKVDGLVRLLLDIARTRQVIVFSHDDRFASAVRRAPKDVPVKVWEVTREAGSKVTTSITHSPARRYLRDAFGLLKDDGLPDETLRRVLPGLLRMALEAQARDTYFARELSQGTPHGEVEEAWQQARKTRDRLELALPSATTIDRWLAKENYRRWSLKHANSIHFKMEHGDPMTACRYVERTLDDLRGGVR